MLMAIGDWMWIIVLEKVFTQSEDDEQCRGEKNEGEQCAGEERIQSTKGKHRGVRQITAARPCRISSLFMMYFSPLTKREREKMTTLLSLNPQIVLHTH